MSNIARSAAKAAIRRHRRVRKKIHGTAAVRAWPCSGRTSTSALQLIDDDAGRTLAAASTGEADLRSEGNGATVAAATRSAR